MENDNNQQQNDAGQHLNLYEYEIKPDKNQWADQFKKSKERKKEYPSIISSNLT